MSNLFSRKSIMILVLAIIMCFTSLGTATAQSCSGYYALAFDDGPNSNTGTLLNALSSAGVKATFFPIGQNISGNMSGFNAYKSSGGSIQNHSQTHSHMTSWSYQQVYNDLNQANQTIQNAGAGKPYLFRPPYLETNSTIQSACSNLGLTIVTCDVDVQDWNGASTSQIVSTANNINNGGVFLMHDGYSSTNNAISQIVNNLKNRSLCAGMINSSGRAVAWGGSSTTTTSSSGSTTTSSGGSTTTSTGGSGNITVRARGTKGGEKLEIRVNGSAVASFNMSTSYADYKANGSGQIRVAFTNDDQQSNGMDVQVDYVTIDGTTYQAENQATNTGVYQNSQCGGSNSEWLHCNGYIEINTGSATPGPTNPPTTTTSSGGSTTTSSGGSTTTSSGGSGTCSPATSKTVPFTQDGTGEYCFSTSSNINYINSWNMATLTVNGVSFANKWTSGSSLPAKINGNYYIVYKGNYSWCHFEAK